MDYSKDQRALEVLGDYLYELETKDRRRGRTYGQQRTLAGRRQPEPVKVLLPSEFDKHQVYLAGIWERERLQEWRSQGRITEDGFLRVGRQEVRPYTLQDLIRIWPHLAVFDRLAALIILDGVVEEGFMEAHENIKAVVKDIAADEVERILQTPEAKARIADIVVEQVGFIFGSLREKLKDKEHTTRAGGRKQRCSKCLIPGHRATTCAKTPEEAAASKAEIEAATAAAAE